MEERVHRALDGELDPAELTSGERTEYAVLSEASRAAAAEHRTVVAPDLTAAVMARVRRLDRVSRNAPKESGRGLFHWLWEARPLVVAWRPAYAAAGLLVLAIGLWTGVRPDEIERYASVPPAEGDNAAPPTIYVQFRLDAPGASTVQVLGSFTDWVAPVELIETVPGVWSTMLLLEPGVHDYTFIVDGDLWVVDPLAPTVDDGFGGSKNRLFLTRPIENA